MALFVGIEVELSEHHVYEVGEELVEGLFPGDIGRCDDKESNITVVPTLVDDPNEP